MSSPVKVHRIEEHGGRNSGRSPRFKTSPFTSQQRLGPRTEPLIVCPAIHVWLHDRKKLKVKCAAKFMHLDEIVGATACGQIQRLQAVSPRVNHPIQSPIREFRTRVMSRGTLYGKGVETREQRGVTELCRGNQLVLDLIEPVHPEQMRITNPQRCL